MSLLIFTYRRQDIIARKSALNFKLLGLNKKLMDLQSYAASIADGVISFNKMMQAPSSMFNRMSIFAQYSHQMAMSGAQQKFALMSQMSGSVPQMQNPQFQQQYQQMMFKSLYDQERQKASDVEQKLLNAQDKKIEQEKAQIEAQLKMLEAEEENVKKGEEDGAKKSAPSYVA